MNKQKLGQFYTTNYDYILQNMNVPTNIKNIIEPFTGKGDLLKFINIENYNLELYDIDPKYNGTVKSDTLYNPPNYDNKFVLTNPPYLARNKNTDKTLYDKYNTNDLYKCFIINLINSSCLGGIIIIPLNFISSIRKSDIELRKQFINKFDIITINIFEEQVFNDTSYTVCCLQFESKKSNKNTISTNIHIYPNNVKCSVIFDEINDYTIGGEIYNLPKNNKIKIERATSKNSKSSNLTNILLKCIDDNINNRIGLSWVSNENIYIDNTPKLSARSYATLIIEPKLNEQEQKKLISDFNNYMTRMRTKYNSLFLTNYRESNTIARKRISFQLVYDICNYLLSFK